MDDIKSLSKKTKKELESINDVELFKLKQENSLLREKILSLESILSKPLAVTPEELICVEQIDIIKQKSAGRELSLDEIKRLDLLIKNLRLVKEQSTQTIEHKDYRNVKEVDLVAIARELEEDN
jgi:hypothetical protein